MLLLFDIGNTNTHIGLANDKRVLRQTDIPTAFWKNGKALPLLQAFLGKRTVKGAAVCSVVPRVTPLVRKTAGKLCSVDCFELTNKTIRGIGIDYPQPQTIGPDRLANAVAAQTHFGAPSLVVDFGTAVTFDVVNAKGNYVGGIIAPGLAAMTDYLHDKTALLPKIKIREINAIIGKNTEQAMLIGAVHGYRGLIRELIAELKRELKTRKLPVVATGGYAKLICAKLPEITAVSPLLTLDGLRIVWLAHQGASKVGGEKVCYIADTDF
ncbi:MAG: type III pantothenate kinase [Verrucomicrobia bacterium]|nr:type III pantothenate kinase [Verrucomicrobiota bacterium]